MIDQDQGQEILSLQGFQQGEIVPEEEVIGRDVVGGENKLDIGSESKVDFGDVDIGKNNGTLLFLLESCFVFLIKLLGMLVLTRPKKGGGDSRDNGVEV